MENMKLGTKSIMVGMESIKKEIGWELEALKETLANCRNTVNRRAQEIVEVGQREDADQKHLIDEIVGLAAGLQREASRMAEVAARRDALAAVLRRIEKVENEKGGK